MPLRVPATYIADITRGGKEKVQSVIVKEDGRFAVEWPSRSTWNEWADSV
ncbi:MAG: hypothetical protein NTY44_12440 [Deltaproteobacteria bacterium]|nr:hypothetical protein [Deltaproteobacteria bacterium]